MKIHLGVLVSCALLAACNTTPMIVNTPAVPDQISSRYTTAINHVLNNIEASRGLSFVRDVSITMISRELFSQNNNRELDQSLSSDLDARLSTEYAQLGFLRDTGSGLKSYYVDNLNQFVAAYYVPGTDSIYVIEAPYYDSLSFEYYLSHELTHALQEQNYYAFNHFSYASNPASAAQSDFRLAQRCVREGDASFTAMRYYAQFMLNNPAYNTSPSDNTTDKKDEFYDRLSTHDYPRFLGISSYAPYSLGGYFVSSTWDTGGWSAVASLYSSQMPASTYAIMTLQSRNPHVYNFNTIYSILRSDNPVVLFADDDNYGPIMLLALLSEYTTVAAAKNGFGWSGDRLAYLRCKNENYGRMVWALSFASIADAASMYIWLDQLISHRILHTVTPTRTSIGDTIVYNYPALLKTRLIKSGTSIWWLENLSDAMARQIIADLAAPAALPKQLAAPANDLPVLTSLQKELLTDIILRKVERISLPVP